MDREVGLDADDGVVRAGHADVGQRRGAAALNPGVRGLHVGVRAEHGGDLAVEPVGERDLLARCLGVDVDDDHLRLLGCLRDELVDELEQIERRAEEERARAG